MAKSVLSLCGDYEYILSRIDDAVLNKSFSASYEDGVTVSSDDGYTCGMRVYERYSLSGGNRVSLSVFFCGRDNRYKVTFITSGGSEALFFKLNTWGEESFLKSVVSELYDLE